MYNLGSFACNLDSFSYNFGCFAVIWAVFKANLGSFVVIWAGFQANLGSFWLFGQNLGRKCRIWAENDEFGQLF